MTRTRPFLTMIRHFSHLLFTDGLTCIRLLLFPSFHPVHCDPLGVRLLPRRTRSVLDDSSSLWVVLREFHSDQVTLENPTHGVPHR